MALLFFGFVLGCIVFGILGILILLMSPRLQVSLANLLIFIAGAYSGFGVFTIGLLVFASPCRSMPSRAAEWFLLCATMGGSAMVRVFNLGRAAALQKDPENLSALDEWRLLRR